MTEEIIQTQPEVQEQPKVQEPAPVGGVAAETMLDQTSAELASTVVAEATPQSPAGLADIQVDAEPLTKTAEPQFTADANAALQTGLAATGLAATNAIDTVGVQTDAAPVVKEAVDVSLFSPSGSLYFQNIQDYIKAMAYRKPVSVEDGSRAQVALYRTLTGIINNLGEDFNVVFAAVLAEFDNHRDGVFHETHAFRFMETVNLQERDRKVFQRLLNLMKHTADVKGREVALRQIDLTKTLDGFSEQSKQKVLSFYNR